MSPRRSACFVAVCVALGFTASQADWQPLGAQSAAAPSRPWSCWMTSGATSPVFPGAVTDPACRSYPGALSAPHLGFGRRARVATPLVLSDSPTNLSASLSGRSLRLRWTPPAGASPDSYLLEVGSASGRSDFASADTGSAAPSLVATDAPPGTYFIRLRARTAGGTSGASNETTVTIPAVCAAAPGAPTGLVATVSGSSVTLAWQAPSGGCDASSYILEAGSAPGLTNLATIPTGSASTTFSASGVGAGTYYVRVRSANAGGTSATSNEVSLTVGAAPCTGAPGAPTNLAGVVSGTSVTLTWIAPATGCSPTSYFLEAGSATGLVDLAATPTGGTTPSYAATAVPNGSYYVRVRSVNASGRSAPSNEVLVTVGGTSSAWTAEGVRLTNAAAGFSGVIADTSTLLLTDGRWRMFLFTGGAYRSAISTDGLTFTMEAGTRLPEGAGHVRVVRLDDRRVRAFHISSNAILSSISSDDGTTFTAEAGQRITASAVGATALSGCSIVRKSGGGWRMYFSDLPVPGAAVVPLKIYSASSTDLLTWTADAGVRIGPNATLTGSGEHPGSYVNGDGSVSLYYFRNSDLGFYVATASDGLSFTTEASVGLAPANDPDIVRLPDGSIRMYYNWGDNRSGAIYSAKRGAP